MGGQTYDNTSYQRIKHTYQTLSTNQIFQQNVSRTIHKDMSPKGLTFRESRDSDAHPQSLAVAVFLDVTGSMGEIPEYMVREKLGTLMTTLINHGVKDAHVLFGGIGDLNTDDYPLQIGQFEAGTEQLLQWLTNLYLEGHGGGQMMEDYELAWLMASKHTSIDCFEKRKQKGFLFTIGDEAPHKQALAQHLIHHLGYSEATDLDPKELLKAAQRSYHVFHIHCQEGSYADNKTILNAWKELLHERLLLLEDKNLICEVIASTVALCLGADADALYNSFDPGTALVVKNTVNPAIANIQLPSNSGVITL